MTEAVSRPELTSIGQVAALRTNWNRRSCSDTNAPAPQAFTPAPDAVTPSTDHPLCTALRRISVGITDASEN
jgi:hypothetical protein